MSSAESIDFLALPDFSRFSFGDDPARTPYVKLGENAYEETGPTQRFGIPAYERVIPLAETEPPDITPHTTLTFIRRGYEWNTILCLRDLLPGVASYATLWWHCKNSLPWALQFRITPQLTEALRRLKDNHLIVEVENRTYRLTGAGIRRHHVDLIPK